MQSFYALCAALSLATLVCSTNVRVVTWNVADNKKMNGFWDSAIDKVLGLDGRQPLPDIYAIGLQEQCWNCDVENFPLIGKRFMDRIKRKSPNYSVVGIEGTRESSQCERMCKWIGNHGTTALVVIAKNGVVKSHQSFHRNDDCSSAIIENDEKGIAAMKLSLASGKVACFGSAHLESKDAETRRKCFDVFFKDGNSKMKWSAACNYEFIFGDFNTRTGEKTKNKPDTGMYLEPNTVATKNLKVIDELKGTRPFGVDQHWNKNLLAYVNKVQPNTFKEGALKFMPTYSIRPKSECAGKVLCYRSNRPPSWTDRIIYTGGKLLKYGSVLELYGDHFPVYGEYKL